MNILYSFLGGPGEAYVESRGTKVSWRPHHTGDICTPRKNKISFSYMKTLTSLAIWGGGGGGGLQ